METTDKPSGGPPHRKLRWNDLPFRWEILLAMLLVGVNIMNFQVSSNYGEFPVFMNALRDFMDKAVLVFPMAMIILAGEIDISVSSMLALSSAVMGVCYRSGMPLPLAMAMSVATGTACGLANGIIAVCFKELSSMIITLSTLILYRGIANTLLTDHAVNFPVTGYFASITWGDLFGIPFNVMFVIAEILVYAYVMHCTAFGRHCRAIGENSEASRFSGVRINGIKIILFTLTGISAGIAAVFLASRMGNTRAGIAMGYEMDVIAMVVLGGFSTAGGIGNIAGAVLAVPIIGLLRYGLGMMNAGSQVILIIVGSLLVVSAAIPAFARGKRHGGFSIRVPNCLFRRKKE